MSAITFLIIGGAFIIVLLCFFFWLTDGGGSLEKLKVFAQSQFRKPPQWAETDIAPPQHPEPPKPADFVIRLPSDPKALEAIVKALEEDAANRKDCLGPAAIAGGKARAAVKAGDFDAAWGFYQEQKSWYMQHANQAGFTARQAIALDSTVSESMADLLRLESRHAEAFVHILYWAIACSDRPIKRHEQKLRAYFNRCKLKNTSLAEVMDYAGSVNSLADLRVIQIKVMAWVDKG